MSGPPLPDGVARIEVPSPFAIGAVNCWVLRGEPLTLVDPGPNTPESLAALEAGLGELGLRVEDAELVLLTHQHHDHVGLAQEVRGRSGAEVAAVPLLARFLADFDASMDADDAYAVAMMARHGIEPDVARDLAGLSRGWRHVGRGVHVDRMLGEGERVRAGSREWRVDRRPGHSPTDTVFHDEAEGLLIGGDHLLERVSSNPVLHAPIGVPDPGAQALSADRPRPLRDYLASFDRTRAMEVGLVLPGHGDPFAGHRELIAEREAMHARRMEKIAGLVDGRRTAADIAHALWRRLAVSQAFLALSEVLGHVDLLEAESRVHEVDDGGVVRLAAGPAPA